MRAAPAHSFVVHGGRGHQQARPHRGQFALPEAAFGGGVQAHAGVGVQLFQEVEVLPVFFDKVSHRALVNGGLHVQVPAIGLRKQRALRVQFQGGELQHQPVQRHFQGLVIPFGEAGIYFQADGKLEAAETARPQPGGGAGRCLQMPPVVFHFQGFQPQGQGVLGQPAGQQHGIKGKAGVRLEEVLGVQAPFEVEAAHGHQGVEGVCRAGENQQRAVFQLHFVYPDGARPAASRAVGLGLGRADGKNLPVGPAFREAVAEDAGAAQPGPVDMVLALQQGHVIERKVELTGAGQGVRGAVFSVAHAAQVHPSARFRQKRIVAGIALVRIGDAEVPGVYVQEGEALDYMGPHLAEGNISFHHPRRDAVHDAGEHGRPEQNLEGDQKHQHQPRQGQQRVPYDLPAFHLFEGGNGFGHLLQKPFWGGSGPTYPHRLSLPEPGRVQLGGRPH